MIVKVCKLPKSVFLHFFLTGVEQVGDGDIQGLGDGQKLIIVDLNRPEFDLSEVLWRKACRLRHGRRQLVNGHTSFDEDA